MTEKIRLIKGITLKQFENGYWYSDELKGFAKEIGIRNTSKLRKDELEKLIKQFIRKGVVSSFSRASVDRNIPRDFELGLKPSLRIVHYVSNKETKKFIEQEALKIRPLLKRRSGARYRLNRWREQQLHAGRKITYADLIKEYIRLNEGLEPFERIAHGRFINFLSDFLKNESDATRRGALKAWKQLKKLDTPKDYKSWKKLMR
jgi:hypothetical protein